MIQVATPAEVPTRPPDAGQGGTTGSQAAPASADAPARVYEQQAASVVSITSIAVVRAFRGTTQPVRGVGSGFVLDAQGRIVARSWPGSLQLEPGTPMVHSPDSFSQHAS